MGTLRQGPEEPRRTGTTGPPRPAAPGPQADLLALQAQAGNAAVAGALSGAVAQRAAVVQRNKSNADLIKEGADGDTDAIVEITDFTAATDQQRLRMVDHLLGKFYVGSRSERALEAIWNSFGDRLVAVVSTPEIARKFANSTVRDSNLLDRVPVGKRINDAFQADVKALANDYLNRNAKFLADERQRLGLTGALPTAEQNKTINTLQLAATEVAKLQVAQQAAQDAWIGWGQQVIADDAGVNHWRRVKFNPGYGPAQQPAVPRPGYETVFFWDDANDRWADARYDAELLAQEQGEIRPYDQLRADYTTVETTLAKYYTRFPALFAVSRNGPADTTAFATAADPGAAWGILKARFALVAANLARTRDKLGSGDLDPLDLTPLHRALFAKQEAGASGVDWSSPLAQELAGRQVFGHNIDRALRQALLREVSELAFLLAPLTEGASMVLLLAGGTAAAGANLVLDRARYEALRTAQQGTAQPGTQLVADADVTDARLAVEADTVAFALAALALGGALAGKTLQALREARRSRLLRQIGAPTTVTLAGRVHELPYQVPPGTVVVKAGQPLDLAALDPTRRYLWLVSADGDILIAPEDTGGFYPRRPVAKHGDLASQGSPAPPQPNIPGAARRPAARAGGELIAEKNPAGTPTGRWVMNNDSSYTFARDDGAVLSGESLDAVRRLMGSTGTDISKIVTANTSGAR